MSGPRKVAPMTPAFIVMSSILDTPSRSVESAEGQPVTQSEPCRFLGRSALAIEPRGGRTLRRYPVVEFWGNANRCQSR